MSSNRNLAISESASLMRRTSPGLSSTSRILVVAVDMAESPRGKLDQREPKTFNRMNHAQKLVEVYWLRDVTVRMGAVGLRNVFLGGGGGQDDHWDFHQMRI